MGSYSRSDVPLTVVRSRSRAVTMTWQTPNGTAVDITGFGLTALVRWPSQSFPVTVSVVDAAHGSFRVAWAGPQVADIPIEAVAELLVSIVDSAGETHDVVFPLRGELP